MHNEPQTIVSASEKQLDDLEQRLTWDKGHDGLEIMEHELSGIQERLHALKSVTLTEDLGKRRAKAASRCEDMGADVRSRLNEMDNDWSEFNELPHPPMP